MGKSHMCWDSQSWCLIQLSLVSLLLGVCAARVKLVALPWPEWHEVQPNFSAGCLLLEPTNNSSRGWAQYSLMRASLSSLLETLESLRSLAVGTALYSGSPLRA